MTRITRPNAKKKKPSLEHLRACLLDALKVPAPTRNRYEQELDHYTQDNLAPYLKPAETKKPERIGKIRI